MKRLLTAGLLLLAGAFTGAVLVRVPLTAATSTARQNQPWAVGRCYRVFPQNREQFYLYRVLEPPIGIHVRVAAEPQPRLAPGQEPPRPNWLIINSLFAVQESSCEA